MVKGESMNRRTTRGLAGLLTVFAIVGPAGCADSPVVPRTFEPVDLSAPWRTADPGLVGLDPGRLEAAAEDAGALERMRSLLVVRDGFLVLERYYHGFSRDSLADVRSVTKSVVSTLAGIALGQGGLSSLDLTLEQLLRPELGVPSEEQMAITVRHLLTMSGGFQWDESGVAEYNDWRLSGDFIQYLLDRPLVSAPGSTFNYNSAAVHLLGVLLEGAIGTSVPLFAELTLFEPLGVSDVRWEWMIDGSVNGGAGIDLRPRDLARFGQLLLQGGRSGRHRVLSKGWVDLATTPAYDWSSQAGPIQDLTYAYLWWVDRERDAFFAWGYGGQFVYVVPSRALVVVATTEWRYLSREGGPGALEAAVLDIIVNGIVPAAPLR
jgi:CubicO group peptidase (beta-lactamase class C family)